ncbi:MULTISPECIES: peptidylprolyl isomerase [Shewanella]|jgi:peptidyl-prolyl cis-trans isomerase A (cyclophilin A)|uniref:Peptidyl-prolyl cis-trans isomerase n=2 Tax=Shewanella putrefaciens TaxID=24 RepID=A4Y3L8_SHEPC|nr:MULTISPECIES: peptidylprolyl isomerase [Shewanella]CAD6366029.1 Peptidyl-prolyl cis-trans isomerase cyp18 [Shewanella hafniensis]ABM26166.1 peptidyl-prolyl cis-trans isomerase, cyclophilin type [Shewanella sp. W3-18-1]AVV83690.1 peptidyl-prolyl cis-trans isomerase [Shewanella putrefaciens]MCA1898854.1 peptidyl-prolyl cis-trans isomerase [Shewanella putrefaciens]MCK7630332.1 peptidylprolyl isomerase [Shewanella sp. JNE9-1]
MLRWISALIFLCISHSSFAIDIQPDTLYPQVEFDTSLGKIVVELDRTRAPITVDNFLTYVVKGEYDNTIFHRVISDFVVQGGGLNPKLDELPAGKPIVNESGNGLTNSMGTIAMARDNDPHSATRQFYFNVTDNTKLDPSKRRWGYAVFGEIIEGKPVLEAMAVVETTTNPKLNWPDVPVTPIILKSAKLLPKK